MATTTRKELTVEEEMKQKLLDILRKLKKKRGVAIKEYETNKARDSLTGEFYGNATAAAICDQIDAVVMTGKMLGILSKYVSPMRWY